MILLLAYPTPVSIVKPVLLATLATERVIHVPFFGTGIATLMRCDANLIESARVIVTVKPRAYNVMRAATGDRAPSAFIAVNDLLLHARMLP